jgi:CrcB protein
VTVLLVLLGGAIGAPTRYLTDRWVRSRGGGQFPRGTVAVNVVGCLILGLVSGAVAHRGWSAQVQALVGTGFCGGLTTFSTFSVETVELWQGRRPKGALVNVLLSCAAGIAAAAVGYAVV